MSFGARARVLEELSCIQTPGKTALVSLGSHFWLYAVVATNGLAWSREAGQRFCSAAALVSRSSKGGRVERKE